MTEYDDDLEGSEDHLEEIIENGELVFFHAWDSTSAGPSPGGDMGGGGAGSERIYRKGKEYVFASEDFGNSGPFASLEDAFGVIDLFFVNSATTEIECTEMSEKELLERIHIEFEDPDYEIRFVLNGKPFRYDFDKEKLVPEPPE
jgi:hypothetical protein